jgi:hypothetical protein
MYHSDLTFAWVAVDWVPITKEPIPISILITVQEALVRIRINTFDHGNSSYRLKIRLGLIGDRTVSDVSWLAVPALWHGQQGREGEEPERGRTEIICPITRTRLSRAADKPRLCLARSALCQPCGRRKRDGWSSFDRVMPS